jgi:predicted nucleic acid-binding protein
MLNSPYKTVLLDTNILIRFVAEDDPQRQVVIDALAKLASSTTQVCICPQNLIEFRQVATRSADANGLGLSSSKTAQLMTVFEKEFTLLPETPAIYPAWRTLVERVEASGRANFDARIVAIAQVNGMDAVLTFEDGAFAKYGSATGVDIAKPTSL